MNSPKRSRRMRPSQKLHDFFDQANDLIDWERLRARLEGAYSPSNKGGRRPIDPIILVKMHLLERWFDLSDVKVSLECDDRISFRRFLGLGEEEKAPDDTTLVRFRKRLQENGLGLEPIEEIKHQLEESGYIPPDERMVAVDGTLIQSQTNAGAKKKGPKKGGIGRAGSQNARKKEKTSLPWL